MTTKITALSPSVSTWDDSGIGMDAAFLNGHIERIRIDMEKTIENIIDEKLEQKQLPICSKSFKNPSASLQTSSTTIGQLSNNFELDWEKM